MSTASVSLDSEMRADQVSAGPLAELLASDHGLELPCRRDDPDLWFSETPADLERAKQLCGDCPVREQCLASALSRAEPWGVWGGEIFERGTVVSRKRPRGRPRKAAAASSDAA